MREFNLLGECRDWEREEEFLAAKLHGTRLRMRVVGVITAMAYLGAGWGDYLLYGSGDVFTRMIMVRLLAFSLAAVAISSTFLRSCSSRCLNWIWCAYMSSVVLGESAELVIKPDVTVGGGLPTVVFIVLAFYLFLPPRPMSAVVAAGGGSIVFSTVMALYTDAHSGHVWNTIMCLFLANSFGIYYLASHGSSLRREHAARSELRRQAQTDSLTRVFNRRRFMDLAGRALSAALRHGEALSVMMLDVDRFKAINDAHGHDVGDAVLVEVAARCSSLLRQEDVFGRVGGEEFAVLLPRIGGDDALVAAERIRSAVGGSGYRTPQGELRVTVSIGLSSIQGHDTLESMLKRADEALYRAKDEGRDRTCCLDPIPSEGH